MIFLILFVLAFFILQVSSNFLLAPLLRKEGHALFRTPVYIEKAGANLLKGSFWMKGVKVKNREKFGETDFFSAKRLSVDINLLSLLTNQFVVGQIRLEDPVIHLVQNETGGMNIVEIINDIGGKFKKLARSNLKYLSWISLYEVEKFSIKSGSISFVNQTVPDQKFLLSPLSLSLERLAYPHDPEETLPSTVYLNTILREKFSGQMLVAGRMDPFTVKKNFDVTASFKDIVLDRTDLFFSQFPMNFEDGLLELKMKAFCQEDILDLNFDGFIHRLKFNAKLAPEGDAGLVFGIPAHKMMNFFNQLIPGKDRLDIQFQVKGDLNDPNFDIGREVRQKFEQTVRTQIENKMGSVTKGPAEGTIS